MGVLCKMISGPQFDPFLAYLTKPKSVLDGFGFYANLSVNAANTKCAEVDLGLIIMIEGLFDVFHINNNLRLI